MFSRYGVAIFGFSGFLVAKTITRYRVLPNLGCDEKYGEKTAKYSPRIAAMKNYKGNAEFVTIPTGHAGTTILKTLEGLTNVLFSVNPSMERLIRADKGLSYPITAANAKQHDLKPLQVAIELALSHVAVPPHRHCPQYKALNRCPVIGHRPQVATELDASSTHLRNEPPRHDRRRIVALAHGSPPPAS